MGSIRVSEEEQKRREAQMREGARTFNTFDPFTWSYPGKVTAVGTGILTCSVTYYMLWYRKPWYAALVVKIGVFAVGISSCYFMAKNRARVAADRDAVVEHYVQLHPEDFEHLKNIRGRLYRDVLLPWVPIRAQYRKVNKEED